MNKCKAAYCRIFQKCFKIAIPFLPYRHPEVFYSTSKLTGLFAEKGIDTVLIITDAGIRKFGLLNRMLMHFDHHNIHYFIYDKTVANPTTTNVEEARELYLEKHCDAIIGFGGGSSIDCAKAVGARIAKPKQSLSKMKGILKVHKKLPLLVAIPTTAGTGSETTLAAVITDARTRHKYAINDFPLIPAYAVLDPKTVLEHAASHLTPVTLELGGKSPCIVAADANLKLAARRIVFGKYLNCGQTCVAPDYVYCDEQIKDALLLEIKKEIIRQYGESPLENSDYGKIINEKHFHRINGLIDSSKVIYGGNSNKETLQIEPTVMDHVTFEDAVMSEEIFGPVMPVLTFSRMSEATDKINSMAHPLALYIFTSSKKTADEVISHTGFGGGCINDTIIHLATTEMGFGGFGESGMGSYHGKTGFDTFSHYKSIVDKKTCIDLPMRLVM